MKLSDIKGERTLEVVAELIEPIANIAADKEVLSMFRAKNHTEQESRGEQLLKRVKTAVPELIKTHKTDVMTILAVIEGVPYAEYAQSLNLVKLVKDCNDLLNDEAFMQLFISAQSGKSSGSAPENTEEREQ